MLKNILTLPYTYRTDLMIKIAATQLRHNSFIRKYVTKNKVHIVTQILKKMTIQRVEESEVLFKKGDAPSKFYVVLDGSVNAYLSRDPDAVLMDIHRTRERKRK